MDFVGETLENVGDGAVQEAWRRVVQKSAQRCDVVGKPQQTLSLGDAIKGTGESNFRGSKFVGRARVLGIGAWNK